MSADDKKCISRPQRNEEGRVQKGAKKTCKPCEEGYERVLVPSKNGKKGKAVCRAEVGKKASLKQRKEEIVFENLGYGTQAVPCSTTRKTCPVQIVFRSDSPKPYLRFCVGAKKPGYLVEFKSVKQARDVAKKMCSMWNSRQPKRFEPDDFPGASLGAVKKLG